MKIEATFEDKFDKQKNETDNLKTEIAKIDSKIQEVIDLLKVKEN